MLFTIKRDDRTTFCGIYNVEANYYHGSEAQNYDSSIIFEQKSLIKQKCYRDLRHKRVS